MVLITVFIVAALSIFAYTRGKDKWVYILIFTSSLLVRLYYSNQDKYLHDWDERYHALVAKNLIKDPLKPVLRKDAVLPYDYKEWWGNHIWLHKQPLFLWQMAASMKIFGVNEFAVRIPSAILCALLTLILYRMGILLHRKVAGLSASLLFCFSFFSIEQSTGAIGMDHNDIATTFYISASLWALFEYYCSRKFKWLLLIGILSGMAILVKWLIGLLVYGCWALCFTIYENKNTYFIEIKRMMISFGIAILVFLPWQLYSFHHFPTEAFYEFNFNRQHLTTVVESHTGSNLFYLNSIFDHYGALGVPMILLGLIALWRATLESRYKILLLSSVAIPYVFFSLISSTKTIGYVFYIAPFFLFISALSVEWIINIVDEKYGQIVKNISLILLIITVCFFSFKYETLRIFHTRGISNYNWENKKNKVHNTQIYKSLDDYLQGDYVVLNCKGMEDVEAMFYSNQNVYSWWPSEYQIDSLQLKGYKIAAFKDHGNQILPDFIVNNPDIVIIDMDLY